MSITTPTERPEHHSLDAIFTRSAHKHRVRNALFASGRHWTYGALDALCASIESVLHAMGLTGRSRNIGLIYDRDAFSYAAIIAIMRSGNVYVPLNPKMPTDKLLRIVGDAGIETVILDTSEPLPESVKGLLDRAEPLRILTRTNPSDAALERELRSSAHGLWRVADTSPSPVDTPSPPVDPASLAYIIYTSGSTGAPKGVAITHDSACRCIEKSHRIFGTCEDDRFTEFSALSFDVSILDLFLCWRSGGTLYVPPVSDSLVPLAFVKRHDITVWSSVPSLANFLLKLRLLKNNALPTLRLFLFCGEALPVELARACLLTAPDARVFNLYGPTECTIFATCHEYKETGDPNGGTVPIGAPLPGVQHRIVDEGRTVTAENEPGELWLTGDQLARGYWNNPAATQAAFVGTAPDTSKSEIWYRTGDRVRQDPVSGLVFLGRIDRQVKLRGYRIELQEIETVLRQVIGCTLVAVIPVRSRAGLCEKIVAYCDQLGADEAAIKARCASRISAYMVPDRILQLDSFPVNESGKINYLTLGELYLRSP